MKPSEPAENHWTSVSELSTKCLCLEFFIGDSDVFFWSIINVLINNNKSQSVVKNAIFEIKNTLEGTNSRVTKTEERISVLENRIMEINEAEQKKKKKRIK